jgi:6-phosphogluconate dehydrogenase
MKDERVEASKILAGPKAKLEGDKAQWVEDIRQALLASKLSPTRRASC